MLTLALLGTLEVSRDGSAVTLPRSRKTRALLAYLAMAERPVGRSRLVEMLWSLPDDPRGALRWSLTKLREIVDDDIKRVIADRDSICIDRSDLTVDALDVRRLIGSDVACRPTEVLEQAAALFRGPFLADLTLSDSFEYQAWLTAERSELDNLHRQILTELCRQCSATPERALPFARSLVQLDPDEADAHAVLLRLLAAGRRWKEAEEHMAGADGVLAEDEAGRRMLAQTWRDLQAERGGTPAPGAAEAAGKPTASAQAATPPDGGEAADMLRRPAVAVLPFENMSGDADQEYFADGITEDLITALCRWRWFPVIARNSTFAYKRQHVDIVDVGSQLGARYVLEGSVRRAGERVRVTAQLIDASNGHHIWAERYDRTLADVFAIQDELTEQIVAQIEPALARSERRRGELKSPQALDAWDLNHRAMAAVYRGRARDFDEAEALLARSIELDPESAHTHALLSLCLYHRTLLFWAKEPNFPIGIFKEPAERAVELDDENWLAHALLGMAIMWRDGDYDLAAEETEEAARLNPSAALAHQFLGCVYNFAGQPEQAIVHLQAARRLNPHPNSATLLLSDLSLAHILLEDYEEAVQFARRAIANFSGDVRARQRLVAALGLLGRNEEAAQALDDLLRRQKELTADYLAATYPFRDGQHLETLLGGLRAAGWRG